MVPAVLRVAGHGGSSQRGGGGERPTSKFKAWDQLGTTKRRDENPAGERTGGPGARLVEDKILILEKPTSKDDHRGEKGVR